MYTDKTIKCADCKQDFIFTASEQEFFAKKGFTNEPKRCRDCRNASKERRSSSSRGGNSKPQRKMYEVVCDGCGKTTEVPFKPTGEQPVYCNDCFKKKKSRY
jgi:CxxC-x17-CxxC domain-containing protein